MPRTPSVPNSRSHGGKATPARGRFARSAGYVGASDRHERTRSCDATANSFEGMLTTGRLPRYLPPLGPPGGRGHHGAAEGRSGRAVPCRSRLPLGDVRGEARAREVIQADRVRRLRPPTSDVGGHELPRRGAPLVSTAPSAVATTSSADASARPPCSWRATLELVLDLDEISLDRASPDRCACRHRGARRAARARLRPATNAPPSALRASRPTGSCEPSYGLITPARSV